MSVCLPVRLVEKPWGVAPLPPPFAALLTGPLAEGAKIGEIWFEPPASLSKLLVKYIFTSENLSVQVHPSDAQTQAMGLGRQGKEETWVVIAAAPGAKLGIGFRAPLSAEAMRAAALDGSIEHSLAWHAVAPGDVFTIPAGTVHAIGAGISLIEVQQNSDITWRLYDYGRGRPLHLDEAVAVARREVYDLARWHRRLAPEGDATLVEGPYFRLDRIAAPMPAPSPTPSSKITARYGDRALLVIPLTEGVRVSGETVAPGTCALAPRLAAVSQAKQASYLAAQPLAD